MTPRPLLLANVWHSVHGKTVTALSYNTCTCNRHPWNKTTLAPVWETLTGVELYSHVNDTGTSFDHYENQVASHGECLCLCHLCHLWWNLMCCCVWFVHWLLEQLHMGGGICQQWHCPSPTLRTRLPFLSAFRHLSEFNSLLMRAHVHCHRTPQTIRWTKTSWRTSPRNSAMLFRTRSKLILLGGILTLTLCVSGFHGKTAWFSNPVSCYIIKTGSETQLWCWSNPRSCGRDSCASKNHMCIHAEKRKAKKILPRRNIERSSKAVQWTTLTTSSLRSPPAQWDPLPCTRSLCGWRRNTLWIVSFRTMSRHQTHRLPLVAAFVSQVVPRESHRYLGLPVVLATWCLISCSPCWSCGHSKDTS